MELNGPSILPQSGNVKNIVVFLHGLGADGNDLLSLSDEFVAVLPDTAFYSPNAPFVCDMAPYGYQWFSLQQRIEEVILEGIKIAAPILNHYLDGLLTKHKLQPKDLALVGFSQGTMMSLYVAPRRAEPIACVVGYSGAMIMPELLEKETISKPPICLVHGDADNVVPYGAMIHAVDALMQNHIPHEAHCRPNLGHGIDGQGITIARNFLKKCLV
jgi:phospholipase/carboxylesterase